MGIRKPGNTQGPAQGPVSPGASRAQEANPPAQAETTQELDPIDALQLLLDLAGMVPGMGVVPDLINSAVSLMRGDFVGALASAASAVPGVGDVAGAAKIAKNAEKYLEAIKAVEQKVLPRLPAAIRTQLQEQLGKLRAKVDELLKKKEKAQAKSKEKPKEKAESKSSDGKGKDGGRSEGSDRGRCTLQPKRKKCPDGKTGHHVVPDHCFVIPRSQGGGRYPGTERITYESGLVICVGGANKSSGKRGGSIKRSSYKGKGRLSRWFADLAEHGQIHWLMDSQEKAFGLANRPKSTASLGELEDAGALSAGVVTGCDPKDLKRQLREYHQRHGLPENTRLRADPYGSSPPATGAPMGTDQAGTHKQRI